MLRLDDLVVLALLAAVVGSEVWRDVPGPHLPLILAVSSASLYLIAGRRRVERAPEPIPPRPAVLIPVKDNHATVGRVAKHAKAHGLPVYVVDDGSTDGSGDAARAAGATVLTHPRNLGKGAALLTGMRAAAKEGHTHVVCLDADGQHDADDIPAFLAAIEKEPVAVFCGVRDLGAAPGVSRFGRRFSNFWIRVETGWTVADSQCGFRAYPIAPVLALGLGGGRYEMEVEVLTRLLWTGVPVRDLPCRVYYPDDRVSSFRKLRDNARISWTNTLLVLERMFWPPRWFPRIRTHERSRWSGASRGTAFGWRFVLGLLRVLGRRPAYAFTRLLAGWYVLFAPGPRRNLAPYLSRAMPDVSPLRGTWRIYRNFAEALVDRLAYLEGGPAIFRYDYEGVEHLVEAFGGQQGAILLSAHLGNIEVSGGPPGNAARMKKLSVVRFDAQGDHGRALVAQMGEAWRPRLIAVNRAEGFSALAVARALREGHVVAMMGDRLVDERTVTVDFLGAPCPFPAGPWLLAAIAHVPVIVAGCFKEDGDTYRLVALPPRRVQFDRSKPRDAQIRAWAQDFAHDVEGFVKRWPDQWYNFHDVWAAQAPSAGEKEA